MCKECAIATERPVIGTIRDIVPAHTLGSEGSDPVVIIDYSKGDQKLHAWIPLEEGQKFNAGQAISMKRVTTYTKHEDTGVIGSCTRYLLEGL